MNAVILGGCRTGFGNFGGSLKDFDSSDLGALTVKEALKRCSVPPDDIQQIVFGNVIQEGSNPIYLGRHIGLKAGLKIDTEALVVNRLCGSGMESVAQVAASILLNRAEAAVAGGIEIMSRAPHIMSSLRWGNKLGSAEAVDSLMAGLKDNYAGMTMGETAEKLSEMYKISREEQDAWSLETQKRAAAARKSGRLGREILPVVIKSKKGDATFQSDEFIKDDTTAAALSSLSPVFKKGGTVTAGNASGINDGSSALIVVSEDFAKKKSLKPLARILSWASRGCPPDQMGIGPVAALPEALRLAGLTLAQMDLVEINEAFAAQFLAVRKELDLDLRKTNVNGGAIAIGHPLGASGNRLLLTLAMELRERKLRYGAASLCIGGGQGIAMILESV